LLPRLGYRKYTQYLTKRNLLILAAIIIFLIVVASVIAWISGSDDSDPSSDNYYAPTLGPPPSDRVNVKHLDTSWKLMGAFAEHECVHPRIQGKKISCYFRQRMSFDEMTDSVVLSKYFASEHLLKCEKLELSGPRKEYM
jgi:hypothetical protein